MSIIVSPSLLAADFANLEREMKMINGSEAEWLHLDVMDGVFVPNISFGFPVIEAVARHCRKKLDAHFMIVEPQKFIERTAKLGVYSMTVHVEVIDDMKQVISDIHSHGMKAGVSLNPATSVEKLEPFLCDADMFLIMSVNPGFGGQRFIESSVEKVATLRKMLDREGSKAHIQVDGGVDNITGARLVKAGATVLVSGSYIFKNKDPNAAVAGLRQLSADA